MREVIAAAVAYARAHAWVGYKRLAWAMIDGDVANLRPGQVYDILAEHDLLGRRTPALAALVRPAEADHPDQRWHTDLMSVRIRGWWLWLIDVLDAYSRYLVFWEILLWAQADAVTLAVQRALEMLDHLRLPGEPEIVHNRGSQFVSREWRVFVQASGMTDVPTRGHHSQSSGRRSCGGRQQNGPPIGNMERRKGGREHSVNFTPEKSHFVTGNTGFLQFRWTDTYCSTISDNCKA
jgi:transposase InsO family protein